MIPEGTGCSYVMPKKAAIEELGGAKYEALSSNGPGLGDQGEKGGRTRLGAISKWGRGDLRGRRELKKRSRSSMGAVQSVAPTCAGIIDKGEKRARIFSLLTGRTNGPRVEKEAPSSPSARYGRQRKGGKLLEKVSVCRAKYEKPMKGPHRRS